MRTVVILTVMATIVFGNGASAQNTGGGAGPQAGGPNQMNQMNQNGQSVRQTLQKRLQDAGFSDIQMLPTSFLVRAKDNQGHPVSMLITPDSVLAVTEIENDQANAQSPSPTTGSSLRNGSTPQDR